MVFYRKFTRAYDNDKFFRIIEIKFLRLKLKSRYLT